MANVHESPLTEVDACMRVSGATPGVFWPAVIAGHRDGVRAGLCAALWSAGSLRHAADGPGQAGQLLRGGRLGLSAGHGAALSALRGGIPQGRRQAARHLWGGSWAAASSSPSPRRPSTRWAPWTSSITSSTAAWRPSTAPTRCSPRRTPSPAIRSIPMPPGPGGPSPTAPSGRRWTPC